jgi:hypothetical protein
MAQFGPDQFAKILGGCLSLFGAACGAVDPDGFDDADVSPVEATGESQEALWGTLGIASTKNKGYAPTEPGADHNRCVPDAGNVLKRLNARGETMGLHYQAAGYRPLDGEYWHAQTVVRLPFYHWDSLLRGQFFLSSFSHEMGSAPQNDGHLGVAKLGFRGGHEGKAVGSNRMFNNAYGGDRADWETTPNPNDTFIPLWGSPYFKIDENENHPGGMSALGWHVVVPLQKLHYDNLTPGSQTPSDSNPYVKIYDLWDPATPALRQTFLTRNNGPETDNMAAAITKLENGKFLLAVSKATPVTQVEFYLSTGTHLGATGAFGPDNRLPDAIWAGVGWHNFNFLNDCNGDLYIIGFSGEQGEDEDEDQVQLYKFDFFSGGRFPFAPHRVVATKIGQKHMYCSSNNNADQCDFQAGAGSYVDPNGQVIVYAVGYSDDGAATSYVHGNGTPWYGTYPSKSGYLRGMEFRERHGNNGAGTSCPTLADAWVEFYEHPDFNSNGENAGQIYHVDYADREMRNSKHMGTNSFNDKASSIRWCIPTGHSFAMYRDPWSGPTHYLRGNGNVRAVANLSGYSYAYGGGGDMNDSITAYWFAENFADPHGWDGALDQGN